MAYPNLANSGSQNGTLPRPVGDTYAGSSPDSLQVG